MSEIEADLEMPDLLVPVLLHIGAQKLTRLTLYNRGMLDSALAEVRLEIPELSAQPVTLEAPERRK